MLYTNAFHNLRKHSKYPVTQVPRQQYPIEQRATTVGIAPQLSEITHLRSSIPHPTTKSREIFKLRKLRPIQNSMGYEAYTKSNAKTRVRWTKFFGVKAPRKSGISISPQKRIPTVAWLRSVYTYIHSQLIWINYQCLRVVCRWPNSRTCYGTAARATSVSILARNCCESKNYTHCRRYIFKRKASLSNRHRVKANLMGGQQVLVNDAQVLVW